VVNENSPHFFSQNLPEDLRFEDDLLAEDDALDALPEYDPAVDEDAPLDRLVSESLLSDFPQLKLATGAPSLLFPIRFPFTSLNEFLYSLILLKRSLRSSFLDLYVSFRSFLCSDFVAFRLMLLVAPATAAFPPLYAATPPAVMAAASKMTIIVDGL